MEVLYLSPSRIMLPPSRVKLLQLRSNFVICLLSFRRSRTAPLLSTLSLLEEMLRSQINLSRETAFNSVTAPSSSTKFRDKLRISRDDLPLAINMAKFLIPSLAILLLDKFRFLIFLLPTALVKTSIHSSVRILLGK